MAKNKTTATTENGQQDQMTEKTISIKKAKIDDEFLYTEFSEHIVQVDGLKRTDMSGTIKREGKNKIHDDLRDAFAKLNPHLGLIAEMFETTAIEIKDVNEETHKFFAVTGFTESGDGVVLIGQKVLSSGKVLNLVTPHIKWDDSDYKFMSELAETIEACKYESEQYLNGKMAPPAQQELEFEANGERTETISGLTQCD